MMLKCVISHWRLSGSPRDDTVERDANSLGKLPLEKALINKFINYLSEASLMPPFALRHEAISFSVHAENIFTVLRCHSRYCVAQAKRIS